MGNNVKVKICGLTNLADAQAAVAAGADLLGFIFFPKSPRHVTPERVRDILAALKSERVGILTVGVFVNEVPQTIAQILDFCGLDLAQLHGEEPPSMLGLDSTSDASVKPSGSSPKDKPAATDGERSPLRGRGYKALRPRSREEAAALVRKYALPASLRDEGRIPAFLMDTYHSHLRGGTGETGDWGVAAALADQYPLLLAGGLTPDNVAQAISAVRPWGVDVASGVEALPGQKDHTALRAFVQMCKYAKGIEMGDRAR